MVSEDGQYRVLSVLGQGGFGTVYHARFVGEGGFSKEVALKVLNPDVENVGEIASRLRDEARILGLIRHRAIVGVDRLTQIDGRWTVVMEYIEGCDLSQLLRRGPVPVGPALEIAAEVAGALHAAYTRHGPSGQPLRLLHRDLKLSNVRVTCFGEVKVLDFGIARAEFQERESKTRSLSFGTPAYMSPERLDFSEDGAPGDVYSLGVVLAELLACAELGRTSANPRKHAVVAARAEALLAEQSVPAPVVALVREMIAFEPAQRPTAEQVEQRALELSRAVGHALLRRWAGDAVPAALHSRVPIGEEQGGSSAPVEGEERADTPWPGEEVPRRLTSPREISGVEVELGVTVSLAQSRPAETASTPEEAPPEIALDFGVPPEDQRPTSIGLEAAQGGPSATPPPPPPELPVQRGRRVAPVMIEPRPTLLPASEALIAAEEEAGAEGGLLGALPAATEQATSTSAAPSPRGRLHRRAWLLGALALALALLAAQWLIPSREPGAPASELSIPLVEEESLVDSPPELDAASATPVTRVLSGRPDPEAEGASPPIHALEESGRGAPVSAEGAPASRESRRSPAVQAVARSSVAEVQVRLEGDADAVKLESGGNTWQLPAKIKPGNYIILASFAGSEFAPAGIAAVGESGEVVVRCSEQFSKCSSIEQGPSGPN